MNEMIGWATDRTPVSGCQNAPSEAQICGRSVMRAFETGLKVASFQFDGDETQRAKSLLHGLAPSTV